MFIMNSEHILSTNFNSSTTVHDAFNKCDLCLAIFHTPVERNQHIFDHFQKTDCSFCQKPIILIAGIWYSPHNHHTDGVDDSGNVGNIHISETISNDIEEFKLEPVMIPDFVELNAFNQNDDPINSEFNYITNVSNAANTSNTEILSDVIEPKLEKDVIDIDIPKNEFSQINCDVYVEGIGPVRKEADSNRICPICGKYIKCATAMKYHLNIHRGVKPYKCMTCEATFSDRRNLVTHTKKRNHLMPSATTKKRSRTKKRCSWICEICNAAFEFEENLIDHTQICHKENNDLPQIIMLATDTNVEKDFEINPANEQNHDEISQQHSQGENLPKGIDVSGMECDETYDIGDDDIKILSDDENASLKMTAPKGSKCEICNKTITCKTGLKYHMNLHLNLKPFSCNSCGKSFADTRNLNKHKKTHNPPANIDFNDYIRISTKRIKLTKEQLKNLLCPACDRTFPSKISLQNHLKSHNRSKFMCKICQKVFRDLVNYKRHRLTHPVDGDEQPSENNEIVNIRSYDGIEKSLNVADWICEYCNCDFEFEIRLAKHIIKEHNEDKSEHLCNICDGKFNNSSALLSHMRAHPESTQYKCTVNGCEHRFAFKSSLGVHLNKHERINGRIERKTQDHLTELTKQHASLKMSNVANENDSFTCTQCNKTLSNRAGLLLHIQMLHTNDRFKCPVTGCGDNVFKSIQTIENHIQNFHPELIKKCDICNKSFYSEEKFNEHRLNHKNKLDKNSFACNLCDKVFTKKYSLRTHLKQHEKDVACNIDGCREKFSSLRSMMAHRERHGKKRVITCRFKGCNQTFECRREFSVHASQHPDEEKKKCICNFCGKAFSSLSYLKGHINTHTGARPFKCTHCEKTFSKDGALRRHLLIHTGVKPYVCDQEGCNQAYRDSIDLKRHKFSMHNIYYKKHICSICSKVFSERKLLTKHTATVHGKIGVSSTTAIV